MTPAPATRARAPRAVAGLAAAAAAAVAAVATAAPTLTPATITVTLAPGETAIEDKLLDIPPIATLPVDVVFVVDSTGSMDRVIASLQAAIEQIVGRLAGGHSDLEVGLVAMRDHRGTFDSGTVCSYSNIYGGPADECVRTLIPLSADVSITGPFLAAVSQLVASGGGDYPECHGTVLQRLAEEDLPNSIGWRPGSFRLIVLLTDTSAHDCDFCAVRAGGCPDDFTSPGDPGNGGVDPGDDGVVDDGTVPRDAPILPAVDRLRSGAPHAPIKLATIFARTYDMFYPLYGDQIGTPLDPAQPPGVWRILSQRTAGDARAVDENGLPPGGVGLAEFVDSLVADVSGSCQEVTADVDPPFAASWITVDGAAVPHVIAAPVTPPRILPFRVTITPPLDTPPGLHSFQLRTFCDRVFLASQTIDVTVTPCQPSAPDVIANSLSATRVPPSPGGTLGWRSTGTGLWNLHATAAKARLPALWSDMSTVVAAALPLPSATDPGSFPPGYFQVYGADSCTRTSVP